MEMYLFLSFEKTLFGQQILYNKVFYPVHCKPFYGQIFSYHVCPAIEYLFPICLIYFPLIFISLGVCENI